MSRIYIARHNIENGEVLIHHGTKGQKWGIRKYQNPDGTLTPAGKARYYDNGRKKTAINMTDQELIDATRRLNLEKNYQDAAGITQKNQRKAKLLIGFLAGAGGFTVTNMTNDKERQKKGADFVTGMLASGGLGAVNTLLSKDDKIKVNFNNNQNDKAKEKDKGKDEPKEEVKENNNKKKKK